MHIIYCYTATDLVLTTAAASAQYPVSNLRKVSFERVDMPDGIEEIEASELTPRAAKLPSNTKRH